MGGNVSRDKRKKSQALTDEPVNIEVSSELHIGLDNFGSVCYCNSVLQALYHAEIFRDAVLAYNCPIKPSTSDQLIFNSLVELYTQMALRQKSGSVSPKKFIYRLKKETPQFRPNIHHDAHEFLNYILNVVGEATMQKKEQKVTTEKETEETSSETVKDMEGTTTEDKQTGNISTDNETEKESLSDLFEGVLINETLCLKCDSLTLRKEKFLELSLEVGPNTSVTACLRNFSNVEVLDKKNQFFCDSCEELTNAEKRLKISSLPEVLCIHLKRFKYHESHFHLRKVSDRVTYPFELKIPVSVGEHSEKDNENDSSFELFAVVVHIGSSTTVGHYVCVAKSGDSWFLFDDNFVKEINQTEVRSFFGSTHEQASSECGYLLFYQRKTNS